MYALGGLVSSADGFDDGGGSGFDISCSVECGEICFTILGDLYGAIWVSYCFSIDFPDIRFGSDCGYDCVCGDGEITVWYGFWSFSSGGIWFAEFCFEKFNADSCIVL